MFLFEGSLKKNEIYGKTHASVTKLDREVSEMSSNSVMYVIHDPPIYEQLTFRGMPETQEVLFTSARVSLDD